MLHDTPLRPYRDRCSPLITLAAADALDCLTRLGLPVLIPDMVYAEVAEDLAKLGAERIVAWIRVHGQQVRIAPTHVFAEYEALRTINPRTRSRGRGEDAALEVLQAEIAAHPDLEALLLFEDKNIAQRRFVQLLPERVSSISTGDLLRELEQARLIQSADRILDEAAQAGRNVERQRRAQSDPETLIRLRMQLRPGDSSKQGG